MQKGLQTRLSVYLILKSLINNKSTYDKLFKNEIEKNLKDLVEKQNAESGGMPVVSNEAEAYGYTAENRHMVDSFLKGKRPDENFDDGLEVTRLLMAAYMSAEQEKTIKLPNDNIETFIPAVAEGKWNPKG